MINNNLELPEDLKERRSILQKELNKVVVELVFTGLRKDLNDLFDEYKVEPKPIRVTWEFNGEYDDEGGTTYYPNCISVYGESDIIEIDDYKINKKSSWSDNFYDCELSEVLHEAICEYREDLYDHDIEEINL